MTHLLNAHHVLLVACLALATLVSACKKPGDQPRPDDEPTGQGQRQARTDPVVCGLADGGVPDDGQGAFSCGSCTENSPVVNGFPINGLKAGVANPEGITLIEGSLVTKNPNCDGRTLGVRRIRVGEVRGYQLVGLKNVSDKERASEGCRHLDLKGATFKVRVGGNEHTLTITEAHDQTYFTGPERKHRIKMPAYVITGGGASLCRRSRSPSESNLWRKGAGLSEFKPVKDYPDRKYGQLFAVTTATSTTTEDTATQWDDLVVAFESELYRGDGGCLARPDKGFFNLACVRDSLAKLDTEGLQRHDPEGGDEYLRRRHAALRLMTNDLCTVVAGGADVRHHFTTNDAQIRWYRTYRAEPGDGRTDRECTWWRPLRCHIASEEAYWTESGTVCISTSRLVDVDSYPSELVPCERRGTPEEIARCFQTRCKKERCTPDLLKRAIFVSKRASDDLSFELIEAEPAPSPSPP